VRLVDLTDELVHTLYEVFYTVYMRIEGFAEFALRMCCHYNQRTKKLSKPG
jgi:hypothetical protein